MAQRVLVVDDSPTIRKVVTSILARRGYSFAEASDGDAALAQLQVGEPFDLILLDFVMPKKNGFQFWRELNELRQTAPSPPRFEVPIVLMTAKSDEVRERFLAQTGAVDSIAKPFDEEALIAVVGNALREDRLSSASIEVLVEGAPSPSGETDDVTSAFKLSPAMLARASRSSERQLPPTMPPPPVAPVSRTELDGLPAASMLFESDELPFSDRASETTQRVDAMSLLVGKLADELEGLFGKTRAELQHQLGERLTPRGLRNVFDLFGELEPPAPLAGSLAVFSPGAILQFVVAEHATGVLAFRREDVSVELTLGDGAIDLAHATGAPLEFRLGRYFVAAGLLSPAELDDFLANAEPTSAALRRPLGERLVDAGKISRHSLREVLTMQSSELVYEVLRWSIGKFEFRAHERSALADRARLALHAPTLVLDGLRRVESWRHIEANLGSFDDILASRPGLAGVSLQRLGEHEQRVLGLVDGERTVRQVIAASSLSSFDACRILAELLGSGMLVAKERA